jgi:hypothetical protein
MLVNINNSILIEGVLNKLIKRRSIKCIKVVVDDIRYYNQVTSMYSSRTYDNNFAIETIYVFSIKVYYKDYIRSRGRFQLRERINTIMTMLGVSTINWEAKVDIYDNAD